MYYAEKMSQFALDLRFDDLPEQIVKAAQVAVADTLACAVAAKDEPGVSILRSYALKHTGRREAVLIGSRNRVDTALAALVNCTAARDLDANDLYAGSPNRDTGHFSDAILAILAVAELTGASGREFLTAVVVAYEIQAALAESYLWMQRGLHSVSQVAWAIAPAAGRLLGLSPEQIAMAVGLAGSTSGLILQSWLKPSEALPLLKAGSAGLVGSHSLEAVELASMGFTAPLDALETLFEKLPSSSVSQPFTRLARPFSFTTHRNMLKHFPAQIYIQAAIQAAIQIHTQVADVAQIVLVTIYGHHGLAGAVQGALAAYRPQTRASADHSTPFAVSMALRDGDFTSRSYLGAPWFDRDVLNLMQRVKLVIDPSYERAFVEDGLFGCRMVVDLRNGQRLEVIVPQQKGHPDNPLSQRDLLKKMDGLVREQLGEKGAERLLATSLKLTNAPDVSALLEACLSD